MRKVIGVMPLYDDKKESYWMLPGYLKMLETEKCDTNGTSPDNQPQRIGLFS